MATVNPIPAEKFYGWKVVAAAFAIAIFGWGFGFYGPPVFLKAVQDARGWSVSLVSAAVTAHFLIGALVVANLPRVHKRFGLPATTAGGAAILALGVAGWALAREPWQLLVATALSGAGWVCLGAAAINAMVSPWFVVKRPAALATAYNGASIGGVIFSPLWVALIERLGFPWAAALAGGAMIVVVGLLATLVLSRTPQSLGQTPDGDIAARAAAAAGHIVSDHAPANLWLDFRFVTLASGMALGLFAQAGLITHMFSLLVPALGPQAAGALAGAATASAILGRTLVGWLMPRNANRRLVAAANYAVQMLGCIAFFAADGANIPLLAAGVILFGFGIGNTTSLPPLIAQADFAPAMTMRVVSLTTAVSQGTYAFAPAAFGLLRDLSGAGAQSGVAPHVFVAAALLQAVAAACYLAALKRFRPTAETQGAPA